MNQVDLLLEEQKEYVTNHGWVTKEVLRNHWMKAGIWLYPCTFKETFCITALEAAASKTLAISTDLAALNDTIGDRGILIPGDPGSNEWQTTAIEKIVYLLSEEGEKEKKELIEKNWEWANTHDWWNLADKMIDTYIGRAEDVLDESGMLNWTDNTPSGSKAIFENILENFRNKKCRILEVGTYTGTSVIAMLKYLEDAHATVIDLWEDYGENELLEHIVENKVEESFYNNINTAGVSNRIKTIKGDSKDVLFSMIKAENDFKYNFIYIDGSHKCLDCYSDIILSWELLVPGGILGLDDYLWDGDNIKNKSLDRPHHAIKHFMERYKEDFTVLHIKYRVFLQKKHPLEKNISEKIHEVKNYHENKSAFFTTHRWCDYISNSIDNGQIWEPHLHRVFEKYVKPDSIVLEAGCHIGTHTIKLAKLCEKLYGFEPLPLSFSILQNNLELNEINNTELIKKGLSNNIGTTTFQWIPRYNIGAAGLNNNPNGMANLRGDENLCDSLSESVSVELITIDSLKLNKLDFVKIDVEGYETLVIEGAMETIARCKPIIVMECWKEQMKEIDLEFVRSEYQNIIQLGYNVSWIKGPDFLFMPS